MQTSLRISSCRNPFRGSHSSNGWQNHAFRRCQYHAPFRGPIKPPLEVVAPVIADPEQAVKEMRTRVRRRESTASCIFCW